MKNWILLLLLLCINVLVGQEIVKPDLAPEKKVEDTYHGVTLEDSYQYLENLEDEKVIDWMKANTDYANAQLDKISGRDELFDTMMEIINRRSASIYNTSITASDVYYYLKRKPGEEIGKVYQRNGYEGEETLFFDPNLYQKDSGLVYTVSDITPSNDGATIAIGLQPNGSENTEVIFITSDGKQLTDKLELASAVSWTKDNNAVFYNKLNSADLKDMNRQIATKVYLHKIGTAASNDEVFFSNKLYPDLGIKDLEFPITIYDKTGDFIYSLSLSVDKSISGFMSDNSIGTDKKWTPLSTSEDKVTWGTNDASDIYYLTFKDAPNFKIVKSSLENPSYKNSTVVVDEHEDEIIDAFTLTKDGLYYKTVKNGIEAKVYFLKNGATTPMQLDLPFKAGYASMATKDAESSDIWITIEGWTSPEKRFKYNPESNSFTHEPLSTPVEYPELADLVAKEVQVKSHDGTMVPVSIVYNKNIKLDSSNPAMIYGYGSYGISIEPFFSSITLAYTTKGGVLVVPHVRGGGELGDAWHKAGQKLNKPNTWKDAIATAEYLIEEGYTNSDKLSILGGSAGGIFVGRSITERPDLFVAGAPMVGAMNTVRMEFTPNGPVNTPEFGTVKDPEEFKGLLAMDSFHSLKENTDYPAMLISSGFNDPRVIAWQPTKFAAKMQRYQKGDAPILLLTNFDQGHGGRTTISNSVKEFANVFSFFYWQSGHPEFQPKKKIKG